MAGTVRQTPEGKKELVLSGERAAGAPGSTHLPGLHPKSNHKTPNDFKQAAVDA